MAYKLRIAQRSDAKEIKYLAECFHNESPYRDFPTVYYKVEALISTFLTPAAGDEDKKMCVLLVDDEKVVGIIAGSVSELLFSHHKIASEVVWYVLPDHRKGTGGVRLRQAFEYWAKEIAKADIIHMACLTDSLRVQKHYEKKGYKLFEMTYLKEIN